VQGNYGIFDSETEDKKFQNRRKTNNKAREKFKENFRSSAGSKAAV